jgi:hypothetical protein
MTKPPPSPPRQRLITDAWTVILAIHMAIMAIVAIWFLVLWNRGDSVPLRPVLVWAFANFSTAGIFLFYGWMTPPERSGAAEFFPKLTILLVGGVLGFTTFVFGILLSLEPEWWKVMLAGRQEWRGAKPWMVIGLLVFGLAIMFASLLAVRSEERKSAGFRRLMYGYNTVLTALLLLMILGFANAIAYFQVTQVSDWTTGHVYTLSPQTVAFLKRLETPVKLYVTLREPNALHDTQTLIKNFKTHTNKIEEKFLDPSNRQDQRELIDIASRYELISIMDSVIVVVETGGKEYVHVLKQQPDLEQIEFTQEQRQVRDFRGESILVSTIVKLQEGKAARKVYFTQSNGELRLEDTAAGSKKGVGLLRDALVDSGYDVQPLFLESDPTRPSDFTPRVPADAFCVVVAGPQNEVSASVVAVLREYMSRGPASRMIVLLGTKRDRVAGSYLPSGQEQLEKFLTEYEVAINRDLVLNARNPQNPLEAHCIVSAPQRQRQQMGAMEATDRAFLEVFHRFVFPLQNVRSVSLLGHKRQVAPLLVTRLEDENVPRPIPYQWAEAGLTMDARKFVQGLLGRREELFARLGNAGQIPIGATVRDQPTAAELTTGDPHAGLRPGKPRLVVFGTSDLIANEAIEDMRPFVMSWFTWLRERPELIGDIEPKRRSDYRFSTRPEEKNVVLWSPGLIMLLIVITCGVSVWFMRRR